MSGLVTIEGASLLGNADGDEVFSFYFSVICTKGVEEVIQNTPLLLWPSR